MNSERIPK